MPKRTNCAMTLQRVAGVQQCRPVSMLRRVPLEMPAWTTSASRVSCAASRAMLKGILKHPLDPFRGAGQAPSGLTK